MTPSPRVRMSAALMLLTLAGASKGASAQLPPHLFFSDLESGPNTGGEADRGVFVTVWGRNFGDARGASQVTVGGGAVSGYPVWTDTRITFQLGPSARSGEVVVATAAGASNPLPFTVRSGRIFFVATTGDDAGDGSFTRPWRTILKAKDSMQAGDTTYLRDGVEQAAEERFDAAVNIESGGEPGRPMAFVAYPGARVTIGSPALEYGLRIPNIDEAAAADYWVLSQLRFRAGSSALAIEGPSPSYWKVTGNDISCPGGDGVTGCFVSSVATHLRFLGNEVHDSGRVGASKLYHAVYFSTDSNHVEAGWNTVRDNNTCRAIQVHSSPLTDDNTTGFNQYDLIIHDNLIRRDSCDGIVLATVDPSKGRVEVYNNVIIRAGAGPHPPDDPASYSCVFVPGYTNTGTDGRGTVEVYNNSCYDFAEVEPDFYGEAAFERDEYSPQLILNLRNNIAYAVAPRAYVKGPANLLRGTNNLFFGNGPGPGFLDGNINADPLFTAAAGNDLHLSAGSPAIDAGAPVDLPFDYDGVPRPQGRGYDVGAFEFLQGSTPPAAQNPQISRIIDAFAFQSGALAPGKLIAIMGNNLGPVAGIQTSYDAGGRLPESAGGVSVTINGRAAPLLFVRSDQINVQVPYELAGTSASVIVAYNGLTSAAFQTPAEPTQPGLFPQGFHADFGFVTAENPARAGEIVIFFATGQGVTVPTVGTGAPAPSAPFSIPSAAVSMTIGGLPAPLEFFALTPGTSGVMQVHVRVPGGLPRGGAAVVLRVGGRESQPGVSVAVNLGDEASLGSGVPADAAIMDAARLLAKQVRAGPGRVFNDADLQPLRSAVFAHPAYVRRCIGWNSVCHFVNGIPDRPLAVGASRGRIGAGTHRTVTGAGMAGGLPCR